VLSPAGDLVKGRQQGAAGVGEGIGDRQESGILKLHGMGPSAMRVLRNALNERGLSFRDG
jgi:hypothetical protein